MATLTAPDGLPSASEMTALRARATGAWALDPAASRAQFHVRTFWGAMTVHGSFEQISGEGRVGPAGVVSGHLFIDASSLNTRNRQRDRHLRSADFFDVEHHPEVAVTVSEAGPLAGTALHSRGTLEVAGHQQPLEFTADILEASGDAVTLRAEVVLDRTRFGMTRGPLHMVARQARGVVTARFVRQ
jgi:polyisoprenoid-binding protein YceI